MELVVLGWCVLVAMGLLILSLTMPNIYFTKSKASANEVRT
jgi:hypothetical protein